MKILFGILMLLSAQSFAGGLKCSATSPPTLTIYPPDKKSNEVMLVFKTPEIEPSKIVTTKSYKIQDMDGSLSLLLLVYQTQDPLAPPRDAEILAALKKRLAYWQANGKSVDPSLVSTQISAMESLIMAGEKGSFPKDVRAQIVRDVVGPMTDYDEVTKYEYSEYKDGKFAVQPKKKLAEILPEEFYKTASSTSSGGAYDPKEIGKTICTPIPNIAGKSFTGDLINPGHGAQ